MFNANKNNIIEDDNNNRVNKIIKKLSEFKNLNYL